MRKKLIAGNWKMHGTLASVSALSHVLLQSVSSTGDTSLVVFPTSIHLQSVSEILKDSPIAFGAQNFYPEDSGAFTGEISAPMIHELGCRYVLVGHSERRQLFGESDNLIAKKFLAAQTAGLTPILCVGETREERETEQTEQIIRDQLAFVLAEVGLAAFENCVIAYEPVWAIGTGLTATPDQAQAVHLFIRHWLSRHNERIAQKVQILYGGSVKSVNAGSLFAMPDIDGALVGGASLLAEEFLAICKAAG